MQATSNKVTTPTPLPIPSKKVQYAKKWYSVFVAPKWAAFCIINCVSMYCTSRINTSPLVDTDFGFLYSILIKSWLAAF